MEIFLLAPGTSLDVVAPRLWDGKGEGLVEDRVLLIRNGKIKGILPLEVYEPGPCPLLKLEGTLMPGLVDAHVHLSLDGKDFKQSIERWYHPQDMWRVITQELWDTLKAGVVAIRDGSDGLNWNLEAKKWVAAGQAVGPVVVATGRALRRKGYYGTFLGPGLERREEWEDLLKDQAAGGCDQVKIVLSGLITFRRYGEVGPVQFSLEELSWLVRRAHALGLKVMVHANGPQALEMALDAGVDSIEHGYFATEELLSRMAEQGVYWCPTVAAVINRLKVRKAEEYSPHQKDIIKRTCESQLGNMYKAHRIGVRMVLGTDAGAPGVYHGRSYGEEVNYFKEAGLDNLSILKAATSLGAACLGLKDLGTIEEGKSACFVELEGDPLADLQALKKINRVFYFQPIPCGYG